MVVTEQRLMMGLFNVAPTHGPTASLRAMVQASSLAADASLPRGLFSDSAEARAQV